MSALRARLSAARHALPELVERTVPVAGAAETARAIARLERRGYATTAGYFHADGAPPVAVAAACHALAEALRARGLPTLMAIKSNALDHDRTLLRAIAATGVPLVFDAMAPEHADRIHALAHEFAAGLALPARWRRSPSDAAALRDTPCRVRLVRGEWADPDRDAEDPRGAYLALARTLAGRSAPVGVATHDPALAGEALAILLAAGTPCELEQLRGLPRRRTEALARRLGVPVRLYWPCGPGWWPYAVDQALARPHLPLWALRDALRL
ncbi:proline dehydrogenase [Tsuneonella sp. HG222]